MTNPFRPPRPERLMPVERLLQDAVAAFRQDQWFGWYAMLRNDERAALFEEALRAGIAPYRSRADVALEFIEKISTERTF